MMVEERIKEQINDLIAELENIVENIEDHGLLDESRGELEGQSGRIEAILIKWKEE